jgi:cold shock CspA family protein
MARRRRLSGTVAEFDDDLGLGVVRAEDGSTHSFHCTAISDGTRHIDAGTHVTFSLVAGRVGRHEADAVTPL